MIRFATIDDSHSVAPLMLQAMEEIVHKIIGREDNVEAVAFLKTLFEEEANQYSHQNTLVCEGAKGQVLGSLVFYDGADLHALRQPVLDLASQRYGTVIAMEDETAAGEIYIDTLSVHPMAQGKGVGSKLISYLKAYTQQPIGLLVDTKNPHAERLYTRLGFHYQSDVPLAGGLYKHLQYTRE